MRLLTITPLTVLIVIIFMMFVELSILGSLADAFGGLFVVLWVVGTMCFGSYLIKTKFWQSFVGGGVSEDRIRQQNLSAIDHIQRAFLSLFAGILLIIPGMITDVFGLIMALPVLRSYMISFLSSVGLMDYTHKKVYDDKVFKEDGFTSPKTDKQQNKGPTIDTPTIDGDFYEVQQKGDKK